MVCSPAGTTIEAVGVLEEHGFRSAIIDARRHVLMLQKECRYDILVYGEKTCPRKPEKDRGRMTQPVFFYLLSKILS